MLFEPTCRPETPYNPADRLFPVVRCMSCYAEAVGKNEDYKGASAITAWNTRSTDPRIAELEAEVERLRAENGKLQDYANMKDVQVYDLTEALKPFASERLPSSKADRLAYNSWGLRCLMSPLAIARNKAIDLLRRQREGQVGDAEFERRMALLRAAEQDYEQSIKSALVQP